MLLLLPPLRLFSEGSTAAVTAYATIPVLTQADVTGNVFISAVTSSTGTLADAKITACDNAAWTKTVGATSADQCSESHALQAVLLT